MQNVRWWIVFGLMAAMFPFCTGLVRAQDSALSSTNRVTVETAAGTVMGRADATVARFLGIPYAQPPVGALRWRLPQPHMPWTGTLDASRFGRICPQPKTPDAEPAWSEDCLYLNVYVPYPTSPGRRPVMVWLHGGTNTTGAGSFYDPTPLVETGKVIVVTLNYRLGALGFLALPALQAESGTTGNYGLADQQLALRWVRANIAAFGGDPRNVTLFGESSGGMDVISQLVSPLAAGLFDKAIVESGAFLLQTPTLRTSESLGRIFARQIGCEDQSPACLRTKSVADVLAYQGDPTGASVAYSLATIDGKILATSQRAALAAGRLHPVPVLLGNNGQEGRLFVPANLTAAQYRTTLAGFARQASRSAVDIFKAYPLQDYATPADGAGAALGDSDFACPDRVVERLLAPRMPTYAYEFDDGAQGTLPLGPTHGAELRYLFRITSMGPALDGGPEALPAPSRELASAMRRYWTGFARSGDPDRPDVPAWRPVPTGTIQMLVAPLPRPGSATAFAARHKCDYWQ